MGEIGPKLGMNANDNGFLGFDHEHIVFPEYVDEKCQSVISQMGLYVELPQGIHYTGPSPAF